MVTKYSWELKFDRGNTNFQKYCNHNEKEDLHISFTNGSGWQVTQWDIKDKEAAAIQMLIPLFVCLFCSFVCLFAALASHVCAICHPPWQTLYHESKSCKGPQLIAVYYRIQYNNTIQKRTTLYWQCTCARYFSKNLRIFVIVNTNVYKLFSSTSILPSHKAHKKQKMDNS